MILVQLYNNLLSLLQKPIETMKQTTTTNHNTANTCSMRSVFNALTKEMGATAGKRIFEWYCSAYSVTIEDEAPDSVKREVFGM